MSFPENRGLRAEIAEGYLPSARSRLYDYCGRLDADGQHRPSSWLTYFGACAGGADECDVAVGSRFLAESGRDGERYRPAPERVVGTTLLRLLMRLRLGQPISDGTSGLTPSTTARWRCSSPIPTSARRPRWKR